MAIGPVLKATAYYFLKQVLFGRTARPSGLFQPMAMGHRHSGSHGNPRYCETGRPEAAHIDWAFREGEGSVARSRAVNEPVGVSVVKIRRLVMTISERLFTQTFISEKQARAMKLYDLLILLKDHNDERLYHYKCEQEGRDERLKPVIRPMANVRYKCILVADELLSCFSAFLHKHGEDLRSLGVTVDWSLEAPSEPISCVLARTSLPPVAGIEDTDTKIAEMRENVLFLSFTQERYLLMGIYDQLFFIKTHNGPERKILLDRFIQDNYALLNKFGLIP